MIYDHLFFLSPQSDKLPFDQLLIDDLILEFHPMFMTHSFFKSDQFLFHLFFQLTKNIYFQQLLKLNQKKFKIQLDFGNKLIFQFLSSVSASLSLDLLQGKINLFYLFCHSVLLGVKNSFHFTILNRKEAFQSFNHYFHPIIQQLNQDSTLQIIPKIFTDFSQTLFFESSESVVHKVINKAQGLAVQFVNWLNS